MRSPRPAAVVAIALVIAACEGAATPPEAETIPPTTPTPEDLREAPGAAGEDADAIESVGEAREAALFTIIDCKGRRLDRVECMIACATAGIPCTPALRHPHPETRPNAGEGDLFRCSKSPIGPTCSYLYGNGDMCFVIRGSAWVPCTYGGG